LQIIGERARRLVALRGFRGNGLAHDAIEIAGDACAPVAREPWRQRERVEIDARAARCERRVGDPARQFGHRDARMPHPAGQQLVQQQAQRVDVAGRGQRLVEQLFGTRVFRCQRHQAGARGAGNARVERLGDAEVEQLRVAAAVDEDVAGLDVAMNDQRAVHRIDRGEHLQKQRDARARIQRVFAAPVVDAQAVDVFHDDVGLTRRGGAAVEHARDVRVIEPGQELAFAFGAADRVGIAEQAREDLDRDALLEAAVAALGQPDLTHAAAAQGFEQAPGAEFARRAARWRGFEEAIAGRVRLQQPHDVCEQCGVVRGRLPHEGLALCGRVGEGGFEHGEGVAQVHGRSAAGLRRC
jgi:hypothetical protein